MKHGLSLVVLCMLGGATIAASPSPQGTSTDTVTPMVESLVGTWACKTAATSLVTKTFTLAPDGSIHLSSSWAQSSGSPMGNWDETYTPDPAGGWKAREASNGWLFVGHSDAIEHGFEFTGNQVETNASRPERESYVFEDGNTFDHAWIRELGVRWIATSVARCSRAN